MGEMAFAMRMFNSGNLPTAIQQINYPRHKGQPNPAHGKFMFVGRIPADCYDDTKNNGKGGSKLYDTQEQAIEAAIMAGADRIQRADCSHVDIEAWKANRTA